MIDYLSRLLSDYNHYPSPYWPLDLQTIMQDVYELATLSYWIEYVEVKNYLEIGVASGGLMHYFTNVMGLKGLGIDVVLQPTLMVDSDLVYVGDCHSAEAQDWAKENGPYDMIFIDGDHSYEAVKLDYELYRDMATKMIVFHDIFQDEWLGPRQLWEQVEGNKLEINSNRKLGIGILFLDGYIAP